MYELYCRYRDKKKLKDSDVSRATGIPQSTFSDWKSGRSKPNTEKLLKIADFLDTSIEYLDEWKSDIITCPDCGFTYDSSDEKDILLHREEHGKWEKGTVLFGELICSPVINEKVKAKNRNISRDRNRSLEERYHAAITVLKCLFSRSVQHSGFDPGHVQFHQYIAMMLHNESYRKYLDGALCQKLLADYGTMDGIQNGESIYYVPRSPEDIPPAGLSLHKQHEKIVQYYDLLNDIGQHVATERVKELTEVPRYVKEDTHYVKAAHAIEGASQEDRQYDEDIMDHF